MATGYSPEELELIIQGLIQANDDKDVQIAKLSSAVFGNTQVSPSTQANNVTWLGSPALVVNGTTAAHTAMTTVSIAGYVPSNATGILCQTELKQSGGGGMILSLYTPSGSAVPVNQFIAPGGQTVYTSGGGGIGIRGQKLLYTITDQSGTGTTTGWTSYKVWILGYTT